jgi:hypothetical protein
MKTYSFSAIFTALLMLTLAGPALAGQGAAATPPAPVRPVAPAAPQPTTAAERDLLNRTINMQQRQMVPMQDDRGAQETRDWFRKVLDQYPPSVREVLQIDTSLLSRPDYLAPYPALAQFLEQHPEVAHNPAYFVGTPDSQPEYGPQSATMETARAWREFVQMVPVVAIVFIITSALAGVIRTLLDQRRWQRAAKMHMEIQNKLLDRFAGNGELLAYLETPTGRGLADLQLPGLGAVARPMDAPATRIFWPLQTGIVVLAAGIGLGYMGPRMGIAGGSISGVGVLVGAIGLGFIVSAIASFILSHRLGLVPAVAKADLGRGMPDA